MPYEAWFYPYKYQETCQSYSRQDYHCSHGGGTACDECGKLTGQLIGFNRVDTEALP